MRSKKQPSFAFATAGKGVRSKEPGATLLRFRYGGQGSQKPPSFALLRTLAPKLQRRSTGKGGSMWIPFVVICMVACACGGKGDKNKPADSSPKFTQYYNQGEELYQKYCSNCHQKNGAGLGRVYPPLNVSDYMNNHFNEVICLMRYGKKGELTVNNVSFHQPMPGIPALTDLEIAEIATYIYNTWSHERGIIEVKEVSTILEQCPPAE